MSKTITFPNEKPLEARFHHRAFADVVILDPSGILKSDVIKCLVDMGADYTNLPLIKATAVNVKLPQNSFKTIVTAGGRTRLFFHPTVDLIIEGRKLRTQVLVSDEPTFEPMLGRPDLLALFEFGFDAFNWYWT